jgi:hypothetical protein
VDDNTDDDAMEERETMRMMWDGNEKSQRDPLLRGLLVAVENELSSTRSR